MCRPMVCQSLSTLPAAPRAFRVDNMRVDNMRVDNMIDVIQHVRVSGADCTHCRAEDSLPELCRARGGAKGGRALSCVAWKSPGRLIHQSHFTPHARPETGDPGPGGGRAGASHSLAASRNLVSSHLGSPTPPPDYCPVRLSEKLAPPAIHLKRAPPVRCGESRVYSLFCILSIVLCIQC